MEYRLYHIFLKSAPKCYLVVILGPFLLAVLLMLPAYLLLVRVEEIAPIHSITAKQIAEDTLYGPIDFHRYTPYKHALYEHFKTDTIAIGSSRVWRFAPSSFSTSFFSLGSTVFGTRQLAYAIDKIYATHPPEFILLGIDYWWFHEKVIEPQMRYGSRIYNDIFYPPPIRYIQPYKDFLTGRISVHRFWAALTLKGSKNSGYAGHFAGNGLDRRGYPHMATETRGLMHPQDFRFEDSLARVNSGGYQFPHATRISVERWVEFEEQLKLLRDRNTEVILFLPPIAPIVYAEMMKSDKFNYIKDLSNYLRNQKYYEFYDYTDVATVLEVSNCEFRDGLHGGDAIYRRILKDMATKTATSLPERLNMEEIKNGIDKGAGYVTSPEAGEVDFLGLGCKKAKSSAVTKPL